MNHYEAPKFGEGYWLIGELPQEDTAPKAVNGMWVEVVREDDKEVVFQVYRSSDTWNMMLENGNPLFEKSEHQTNTKNLTLAKDGQYFLDIYRWDGLDVIHAGNVLFRVGDINRLILKRKQETSA